MWVNGKGELVNLSGALPSTPEAVEKSMANSRLAQPVR
ncbi:MAG: hypothetical protein JWO13_3232 [Acidobacteriales bacterium]|nr:hypothetical protein [Terriglobales bacterium]